MYTCVAWVKQGVAKEIPDKVQLTEDELKELIEDAKEKINDSEGTAAGTCGNGLKVKKPDSEDEEDDDDDHVELYDLDHYDDGDDDIGEQLSKLTVFASPEDDPCITLKNPDDVEKEDFQILPTDNLVVAGKVEEEYCCAEVYVYNEEENSFYIHHDILLDSYPLAMEWLSFDKLENTERGNLLAIGTMEPQIQIWDLDIVDIVSPPIVLGKGKKSKKKKKQASSADNSGHQDAVLALSWNQNMKTILASGSADTTVVLWDLQHTKAVHSLKHHKGKVVGLQWHPYEMQSLLTCALDRTAQVLDCRSPESNSKTWKFPSRTEQCLWNPLSPYYFLVGTENGVVHYCDVRNDKPVYNIDAHTDSVDGMALSLKIPGCLVTVSADKSFKVWDIEPDAPKFVVARASNIGRLHSISACPEHPFTFAIVAEKDIPNIFNVLSTSEGKEYFGKKHPVYAVSRSDTQEGEKEETGMECEPTAGALASLNLSPEASLPSTSTGIGQRIKKKKKKKK